MNLCPFIIKKIKIARIFASTLGSLEVTSRGKLKMQHVHFSQFIGLFILLSSFAW